MNKDLTELVLITDRSGSMKGCAPDMNSGIVDLLKKQRAEPGSCNVTWIDFDDTVDIMLDGVDIKSVDEIVIKPRGGTALYDAICKAVDAVGQRLAATPEAKRPGLVIVCTVTDGGENASTQFTYQDVNKRIATQKNQYNWQFMYLGANQDSFAIARHLSIDVNKTSNFKTSNANAVGAGISGMVSVMRGMSAKGLEAAEYTNVTYDAAAVAALNK